MHVASPPVRLTFDGRRGAALVHDSLNLNSRFTARGACATRAIMKRFNGFKNINYKL